MKTAFFLIVSGLLYGCSVPQLPSSFTPITRIISNESDYTVLIKSYFNQANNPRLDTLVEISLSPGEKHTAEAVYAFHEMQYSVQEGLIETLVSVDSVVVIFDSEKYQVHCLVVNPNCNVDKLDRKIILSDPVTNDLEHLGYDLEKNGENNREWIYTISNQDYGDAVNCNGHPRCNE